MVQLESLYPNCKAMQLGCGQSAESSWKLEPYSPQSSHYGLLCAPQVSRYDATVMTWLSLLDRIMHMGSSACTPHPCLPGKG